MQKSARLDAVQSEFVACHFDYPLDRSGRQTAACILAIHPVSQPHALERAAHDSGDVESTNECIARKKTERIPLPSFKRNEAAGNVGSLPSLPC